MHLPRRAPLALLLTLFLAAGAAGSAERPLFVERSAELGLVFTHMNGMSGELYFVENMGAGAALFDYDGDGDPDALLVQGAMLGPRPLAEATFPPAPGMLPLGDRLFRNDLSALADGTIEPHFVDVTARSGLVGATGYGMGLAVGDIDGDGDPDFYRTAFGPNQLWRNRGDGTFEEVTAAAGIGEPRWSVPACFFDFDGDSDLDLYVGNYVDFRLEIHSPCLTSAGRPIYCGPRSYRPETDRLFRNRGDGTFDDVSTSSLVGTLAGNALGAIASDFDGDGRTDLYVANDQMPNFLWLNEGDGTFREEALLSGVAVNAAGDPEASMGVTLGDFDGDGDEDLFITHLMQETNTLYRAEGGGLFSDDTLASGMGAASFPYTAFGTAFFDYDGDGWPDLLAVNGAVRQLEDLVEAGDPYPLHQPNQLFHNLGGGRGFEDVTARAGAAFTPSEVSRGLALGDVDGDGDPDVLVTNNAGPARLLVNQVGQDRHWLGVGVDALGSQVRLRLPGGRTLAGRVHTDGSYASASDPRLLFGLGDGEPGEVWVSFPDGRRWRIRGLPANRHVRVIESAVGGARGGGAGRTGEAGGADGP